MARPTRASESADENFSTAPTTPMPASTPPVPPQHAEYHNHDDHDGHGARRHSHEKKNFELDTSSKTILVVLALLVSLFLVFTAGVVTGSRANDDHDDRRYNIQAPGVEDGEADQRG